MPFCTQCGSQVAPSDQYCGKCGGRQQAAAGASPPGTDYLAGISNRTASLLCYIPMVGWVAGVVILASERFRHEANVRFHAFQGLYLFVAWLIIEWVLRPMIFVSFSPFWDFGFRRMFPRLLEMAVFACWIWMIIKVSQDENYKLPILGELAERSVSEQRP